MRNYQLLKDSAARSQLLTASPNSLSNCRTVT